MLETIHSFPLLFSIAEKLQNLSHFEIVVCKFFSSDKTKFLLYGKGLSLIAAKVKVVENSEIFKDLISIFNYH